MLYFWFEESKNIGTVADNQKQEKCGKSGNVRMWKCGNVEM